MGWRIGITDTLKANVEDYVNWVKRESQSIEAAKLSHVRDSLAEIDSCDGLVLTGGGDVSPKLYGRPDGAHCAKGVNEARDMFELELIERALKADIPILGICRGLQIANVFFRGTLIADLESAGFDNHRLETTTNPTHVVSIESNARLSKIAGCLAGQVNSAHHQAAGAIGKGLVVAARSSDGVVEALERVNSVGARWFLLVQWHPERMRDFENPFSRNVLNQFLSAVQQSE